ncbi:hypothetical protein [Streptomyces sp. NBC_00996]|nr:hypothetical protein OG390_48120 [Streptomyces sp. NBC_00996]
MAIGVPLRGSRNGCWACTESGATGLPRSPVDADGAYLGAGVLIP